MGFKIHKLDLEGKKVSSEKYDKAIKTKQLELVLLQRKVIENNARVIICFEGCDAAGKGGAIKRLTETLDPRGYMVHPIGAPSAEEKSHHYLWRFWRCLPPKQKIAIFDRTWYGRLLVERVEGFCKPDEWKRAFDEICQFERWLADDGYLIIKFWLQITKEEQLMRFKERQDSDYKRWKITDEDWRNRDHWDKYENAVNDMIEHTSKAYAEWTPVEANDKRYARLKVMNTVLDTLRSRFK